MIDLSSLSQNGSVDKLVQQYRTSQQKPIRMLEDKKIRLTARLKVLGELRTKLKTLTDTVSELTSVTSTPRFKVYTVASSNTTIATATASSSAQPASHTLLVTRLAKADTILSSEFTKTGTNIVTAEGAGAKQIQVSVNGVNTAVNVTVNAGETNDTILSNMASALNASTASVTASVVNVTSTTAKLVITSKVTGSAQAVSLSDVSGTLLSNIGLTSTVISSRTAASGASAGYVNSSTASLDANFALDGISIVRGTNTVSDALTGVTFELKGVQNPTDTPISLTVGIDKEKVRANIDKFLKDYNDTLSYLRTKTTVDPTTNVREILAGDYSFISLRSNLRTITGSVATAVPPEDPKQLSEVGIEAAADGTLSVRDSAKLESAMGSDGAKLAAVFKVSDGIAVRLKSALDPYVSIGGVVDAARQGTDSQMTTLASRVSRFQETVDRRVKRFKNEMVKLQVAVAKATRQQQMLQRFGSETSFF